MLNLMRKHAGSWIIKILLGAIAVAFALSWGVTSYYSRQSVAVKVNDEPITFNQVQEEFGRLTESYRAQFGPQFDKLAPQLNLKQQALNGLVDRALLFQAAQRMGIRVSDAEVRAEVAATPAFARGGQFDLNQYKRVLAANKLTPEMFEGYLRGKLIQERLITLVTGAAQVTPMELEQALEQSLAQVQGVYLLIKPESFLAKTQASPEETATWYQEHKNSFMQPERVRFSYLVFPLASYRDQVDVTDDDVAESYERERARYFQPEAVRARHILVEVKPGAGPAEEDAAKARAEDLLARAKGGKEDFAALAKKHSQGPTAAKGGDLGLFTRGEMVGPFEELAFGLGAGEVGLVRANQGWHVVKVEERRQARVVPLDEVRGEIRARLMEQGARERAEAAAERAFDKAAAGMALADLAKEHKLTPHKSPLMTAEDDLPGLPGVKGLVEALDGLSPGQAAPVLAFEGGSLLAVLEEKLPEQIKPLDEVKDEVARAVKASKAARQAEEQAQELIRALSQEADPAKALAAKAGAKRTNWLGQDDDVEGLTPSTELVQALFLRPTAQPLVREAVKAGGGLAVAAVSGRRQIEAKGEDRARRENELRQRLLYQKRQEAFYNFRDDLRAKANVKVLAQI